MIKFLKTFVAVWFILVFTAFMLLSTNISGIAGPVCALKGAEAHRYPQVVYDCDHRVISAEQWVENLRVINKFVVYDGSFACYIFTSAMNSFVDSGSDNDWLAFKVEVEVYSRILAMAAQTAAQAPDFMPGIRIKAKLWELQFRLAHYFIDGPLNWFFPISTSKNISTWMNFYIFTIRIPQDAFNEMCEVFEKSKNACYLPEVVPVRFKE